MKFQWSITHIPCSGNGVVDIVARMGAADSSFIEFNFKDCNVSVPALYLGAFHPFTFLYILINNVFKIKLIQKRYQKKIATVMVIHKNIKLNQLVKKIDYERYNNSLIKNLITYYCSNTINWYFFDPVVIYIHKDLFPKKYT